MSEIENESKKACKDWTPRDHFIKATQCLEEAETLYDATDVSDLMGLDSVADEQIAHLMHFVEAHSQLAAIPASQLGMASNENGNEDYRP